jgi:sortase A
MTAMRRHLLRFAAIALVACTVVIAPGGAMAERSSPAAVRGTKPRLGRAVATVRIPAINLDVQLLYGIHDGALARGLGLWPGTALPGKPGNAVVAGHRTSHGAPMRDIDKLRLGDRIYVTTGGKKQSTLEYRITKRQIVRPNAMWITRPTKTSTMTIFACHPPHSIAYRYVIFAKLVGRPMTGNA